MTIWILSILLMASTAALGHRQGVIRVGFSLLGILVGALVAPLLGRVVSPWFLAATKNPILSWALGPFVVFVLILVIFKIAGLIVHKKVDLFYRYKAGNLRLALWQRLNARLGLSLGVVNGAVYTVLLSFVIYTMTYWTAQMSSDTDPAGLRLLNRLGKDIVSTGMAGVVRSVSGISDSFYETADITGLLYRNPLLEARATRYPGFLAVAEKPELQALAGDSQFTELLQRQAPLTEVMKHPTVSAVLKSQDTLKALWSVLEPDTADVRSFLETGRTKYDSEKILGRWIFDVNGAIAAARKAKPNMMSSEMRRLKATFAPMIRTTFIAAPTQEAILKNLPKFSGTPGAAPEFQSLNGEWKGSGGRYEVTFKINDTPQTMSALVEVNRLSITGPGMEFVFLREN